MFGQSVNISDFFICFFFHIFIFHFSFILEKSNSILKDFIKCNKYVQVCCFHNYGAADDERQLRSVHFARRHEHARQESARHHQTFERVRR